MPHRRANAASRAFTDLLDARIIGSSPPMRRLKSILPRVARSRANVLIQGESGTGKELVARAVHTMSPRSASAFVAENCAALPDGVIESELFGHVRGAFTGADRDREGLIALANGGTLFLDEVGDLPPRIQAKLLRVIQEGEFRPVGSRHLRRSDFRVIAATHRDLSAMVERGAFREDLYYRLNVIQVEIPPLRDRVEDIPVLVERILSDLLREPHPETEAGRRASDGRARADRRASGADRPEPHAGPRRDGPPGQGHLESGAASRSDGSSGADHQEARAVPRPGALGSVSVPSSSSHSGGSPGDVAGALKAESAVLPGEPSVGVSREAMEMLLRYPWPGNVRELQNVVEAALVMAVDRVIGVAELPERIIDHALAQPEGTALGEGRPHERVMIEMALSRFRGDKAKAARYIGWSRPKLYRQMSRYGIPLTFGKDSV